MIRHYPLLFCITLLLAVPACGDKSAAPPTKDAAGAAHAHDHDQGPHGGALVEASDGKVHFELVHHPGGGAVDLYVLDVDLKPLAADEAPVLNLRVEGASSTLTATAAQGAVPAGSGWRFEGEALKGHAEGRFRVIIAGQTYTPDFQHAHDDDHGHAHAHDGPIGPHDGMVAELKDASGAAAGWIELKLHDDKGDLEAWLAKDKAISQPLDLPLTASLKVMFEGRTAAVTLSVRDSAQNPDEDGNSTVRSGKTNYFIFPGDTGADATWLMGKEFSAKVRVEVPGPNGTLQTTTFTLVPHSHDGDHEHE